MFTQWRFHRLEISQILLWSNLTPGEKQIWRMINIASWLSWLLLCCEKPKKKIENVGQILAEETVSMWLFRYCTQLCYFYLRQKHTKLDNWTTRIEHLIVKIWDQVGSDWIWSSKKLTATPHTKGGFGPPQLLQGGKSGPVLCIGSSTGCRH